MDYSAPLYENISIENEEMNSSQWTQFMQLRKEAWKKRKKKKFRTEFFFSGFFTQLRKLRSLRRSCLHFDFISAVNIWFISYIINTD